MRMTFFHLCRRCTTQQKGSSFLLTKDIASRYGLWSILKLEALNCVAWFFLRACAAARTCGDCSFGAFDWQNIALARLLLVCHHLKKDLIWAFTRLMNSSSFWARWAFLYPLVVVSLLVVTDCVPKPHPPLPTGAERRGWSNWCWALGIGFRWQGSSESTALCQIDERLFSSWWEGLHGVQVPALSTFPLYFCSMPYSTSSFTGCKSPGTCSSSAGKGKGAPKKAKDLSKRHHLFKKNYQ